MNAEAVLAAILVACSAALLMPAGATRQLRAKLATSDSDTTPSNTVDRARAFVMSRLATRKARARMRERVREAVAATAAELRAGQPINRAFDRGCASTGVARRALAALAWGGDMPAALRADAQAPGCSLLASVAACWSVAEGRGAGLAAALDRLVEADRAAEDVRVQLEAHLAAPRATARMLAALPLLGLMLGASLGGDPVGWLLGSPFGFACLVAGLLLIALGLLWTARIAARVERLL